MISKIHQPFPGLFNNNNNCISMHQNLFLIPAPQEYRRNNYRPVNLNVLKYPRKGRPVFMQINNELKLTCFLAPDPRPTRGRSWT